MNTNNKLNDNEYERNGKYRGQEFDFAGFVFFMIFVCTCMVVSIVNEVNNHAIHFMSACEIGFTKQYGSDKNKTTRILGRGQCEINFSGKSPNNLIEQLWAPEHVYIFTPKPFDEAVKTITPASAKRTKSAEWFSWVSGDGVTNLAIDQPLGDYEMNLIYTIKDNCPEKSNDCIWTASVVSCIGDWVKASKPAYTRIRFGHDRNIRDIIKALQRLGVLK